MHESSCTPQANNTNNAKKHSMIDINILMRRVYVKDDEPNHNDDNHANNHDGDDYDDSAQKANDTTNTNTYKKRT